MGETKIIKYVQVELYFGVEDGLQISEDGVTGVSKSLSVPSPFVGSSDAAQSPLPDLVPEAKSILDHRTKGTDSHSWARQG